MQGEIKKLICFIQGTQNKIVFLEFEFNWIAYLEVQEMIPMLPPVWIMVLTHLEVGLNLNVFHKQTSQELGGPRRPLTPFKGEHLERARTANVHLINPKGKPLCSHMSEWKNPVHPDTPIMIGGPQVIGCTESQVIGGHQSEHYSAINTASLYHYPFIYEPSHNYSAL